MNIEYFCTIQHLKNNISSFLLHLKIKHTRFVGQIIIKKVAVSGKIQISGPLKSWWALGATTFLTSCRLSPCHLYSTATMAKCHMQV